jgi:hypothetical protein
MPEDDCTYCGSGGEALAVDRHAIFADEWDPDDMPSSVVLPGVSACRHCARAVRQLQLRLSLTWGLSGAPEDEAMTTVDPRDVDVMTRRLVRALYRWETNEPLPMDAGIQSAQLSSERPDEALRAIVAQGLERRELQPGIVYWFARASDSECGSIWYAAIWSRIFLFAKTLSPRECEVGDDSSL